MMSGAAERWGLVDCPEAEMCSGLHRPVVKPRGGMEPRGLKRSRVVRCAGLMWHGGEKCADVY